MQLKYISSSDVETTTALPKIGMICTLAVTTTTLATTEIATTTITTTTFTIQPQLQ
jgi:hypothetical protein